MIINATTRRSGATAIQASQLFLLQEAVHRSSNQHTCVCSRARSRKSTPLSGPDQSVDSSLRELIEKVESAASSEEPETAIESVINEFFDENDRPTVKVAIHGYHRINCGFAVVAGSAIVEVGGNAVVVAVGKPQITARQDSLIYAANSCRLSLYDNVFADCSDEVSVRSYDSVRGVARGRVQGTARGKSRWAISGNAHFDTFDNAMAESFEDAQVRAYGRSRVCGRNRVKAELYDSTNGWFTDDADVMASGSSIIYPDKKVKVRLNGGAARIIPLPANQTLELF